MECDGLRPTCFPCQARELQCVYEADPDAPPIVALKRKHEQLQRESRDAEELISLLKSRPEHEAIEILRRIRNGHDLSVILSRIRNGDVSTQPRTMTLGAIQYALPPFNSLTEFELSTVHPTAYPILQPIGISADLTRCAAGILYMGEPGLNQNGSDRGNSLLMLIS